MRQRGEGSGRGRGLEDKGINGSRASKQKVANSSAAFPSCRCVLCWKRRGAGHITLNGIFACMHAWKILLPHTWRVEFGLASTRSSKKA